MEPSPPNGEGGGSPCRSSRTDKMTGVRQQGARAALITLTAINFLNFADRYVPSAVKSLIQADLHLTDFETSLPSTGTVEKKRKEKNCSQLQTEISGKCIWYNS